MTEIAKKKKEACVDFRIFKYIVMYLLSSIFFNLTAVAWKTQPKEIPYRVNYRRIIFFLLSLNSASLFSLPKWYLCVAQTRGEQGPWRAVASLVVTSSNHLLWEFQKCWYFGGLKFISIVVRVYKYSERHLQIDIVKRFHTHSLNTVKTPAAAFLLGRIRTFFKLHLLCFQNRLSSGPGARIIPAESQCLTLGMRDHGSLLDEMDRLSCYLCVRNYLHVLESG